MAIMRTSHDYLVDVKAEPLQYTSICFHTQSSLKRRKVVLSTDQEFLSTVRSKGLAPLLLYLKITFLECLRHTSSSFASPFLQKLYLRLTLSTATMTTLTWASMRIDIGSKIVLFFHPHSSRHVSMMLP